MAAVVILFDSIRRWTGARRRPEPTAEQSVVAEQPLPQTAG